MAEPTITTNSGSETSVTMKSTFTFFEFSDREHHDDHDEDHRDDQLRRDVAPEPPSPAIGPLHHPWPLATDRETQRRLTLAPFRLGGSPSLRR